ncbi:MAG TPA: hypothetical protein VMR50_02765 [Myxococcota bacterium]|nr:hypothetical protein [Myxococcota bacterium]
MTPPVEAAGAPVEQGRAQGHSCAQPIRAELARLRASLPWLARRAMLRRVRATSARALETQLPWQRERIEGIAQATRVAEPLLLWAEAVTRVQGAAWAGAGPPLAAAFELRPPLDSQIALRRSAPDAGGFASAELVLAPLAGCLAGVNSEGIAVVCTRDLSRDELSLRFLAQELLFRARDLDAGVDHLRRRAAYAGGTGTLVAVDASGRRLVLAFRSGQLTLGDARVLAPRAVAPQLELEPAAARLTWRGADGRAEPIRLEARAR